MRIIAEVDLSNYFTQGKVWLYNTIKDLQRPEFADDERILFFLDQSDIFEYDEDKGEIETYLDLFIKKLDIPEYFIIKRFASIRNIPTFEDTKCIQPWTHFYFDTIGKILPCCIASGEFNNVNDFVSINDALNSEAFKELRLSMLNNKKPKACAVCYEREKEGSTSWRQELQHSNSNQIFNSTNIDGSIDNLHLLSMNIAFDNTCNLKCRMCYNVLSSRIEQEDIDLGLLIKPNTKLYDSSNFDTMFTDIKNKALELNSVHFFGGEPLISKNHYEVLDHLLANSVTGIELRYHTNLHSLTFKSKNIIDYWIKFSNVHIAISLDDLHKRGEYIRHGMKWDTVMDNIQTIKQQLPHVNMRIHTTVSIYNALHVTELHKELLEMGLFDCSTLELHIAVGDLNELCMLPNQLKVTAIKNMNDFITYIQKYPNHHLLENYCNSIINHISSDDKTYLLPKFLDKVEQVDKYRKESFFDTFPELNLLKEFRKK